MASRAKRRDKVSGLFSERMSRFGMYILFCFVPLIYYGGLYSFTILPKRILVQLVLLLIAIAWLRDHRTNRSVPLHHSPLNLPILFLVLTSAISITVAINPLSGLVSLAHYLTFILLFFLLTSTFPISAVHGLLRVGALVGIVVSLLGILESRGANMSWLISNGRPSATFGYRNFAAAYLVMVIPLSVCLSLRSKSMFDFRLGVISTGLMTVFLVYTRTRGAWAGLLGSMLICVLMVAHARYHWKTPFDISKIAIRKKSGRIAVVFVVLVTVILSLFEPRIAYQQARAIDEKKVELLDALTSVTSAGADRERGHMWRQTGRLIQDNLVMGVGVGNWKHIYPQYDGGVMLRPGSAPEHPHNDFLAVWAETGTIGLSAYLWLLLAIPFAILRILQNSRNSDETITSVAFGAGIMATLGHSLFSFPRDLVETSLVFWTGLAILALLDRPRKPAANRSARPGMLNFLLITTVLLITTMIWFSGRHIRFDTHYLQARQYHKSSDYRAMLESASNALEHGPFEAQAFLLKGKGFQSAGMPGAAIESLGQGLRYHPHSAELLGDMGIIFAEVDSLSMAEKYLNRALELSPTYYHMLNNLGGVYQKAGNYNAAVNAYKRALEHDSTDVGTLNNLGLVQMKLGLLDASILSFGKALKKAPGELWIHHNLGDALFRKSAGDPGLLQGCKESYNAFLRLAQKLRLSSNLTETAKRRVDEISARLGDLP